jgi:VanZ family protein
MTTPSEPPQDTPSEGVDLGKHETPAEEEPFDPYRFGKPDYPIPAEYAPPGYTGPVVPATNPYQPPNPFAAPPPGAPTVNPFSNPPGTPYSPSQQQTPPYPPYRYGYGPGAPPPYQGYTPFPRRSGKAVAALVFGILSIVFSLASFFDIVFVILGLVFGFLALSETKVPGVGGRSMAVSGLACTLVGALLATVLTVLIIHAANDCGGLGNSSAPGWQQCVRDNFG